jgi:hypothetical protein
MLAVPHDPLPVAPFAIWAVGKISPDTPWTVPATKSHGSHGLAVQPDESADRTPKVQVKVAMPEYLLFTSSQEACAVPLLAMVASGETDDVSDPKVIDTDVEVSQLAATQSLVSAVKTPSVQSRV